MKTKNIAILAALSLGFTASALAADGTINFSGELITQGCTFSSGSNGVQAVSLDKIKVNNLSQSGDIVKAASFSVQLTNCPLDSVALRLGGTPDAINSDLFKVATSTAGSATNVGIGLYESDDSTKIPVNGLSAWKTLSSGAATFNFIAKYVATGTATAGLVTAATEFTIAYK